MDKWKVKNDNDAEWIIDKTNDDLIEIRRFKESIKDKIEILKDKLKGIEEEEKYKLEQRNSYLLEYFEAIPEELKKKTKTQEKYRLPSGEIVKKYPAPEFKRDEETLLAWAKVNAPSYVEVKETPKWGELKKITKIAGNQVVTEDGEVVEGVEVVERPPALEFKEG